MTTHRVTSSTTDAQAKSCQLEKTCLHFLQVGFRLLETGIYLTIYTTRFGGRLLWNKMRGKPVIWQVALGHSAADLCNSLGATFIKFGQIMSTRCDLLPPEVIAPLIKLQDNIQPIAFHHIPPLIKEQFGSPLEEIFAEFDTTPVSSASIASVYRARLFDGRQVAVKIRRPEIARRIANDLQIMRFMARTMGHLRALRQIPMIEMINELGQYINAQVDFRIEAENNQHFRLHFAHEPLLQFPVLVEAYCTEAILTMDFIEDLVRIDELDWTEEEYQQSLMTGLKALYHMIFLDGFIHCDLHPGNMYFRKGGKVVMLDTGFIARLERQSRFQFTEFFLSIATNAGKKCADILYESAFSRSVPFDHEGFEKATIELINNHAGSNAEVFQVAPFVAQVFEMQRRFGLRGSTNFTMAILSLLVFEGIAKQLYPRLDFQRVARPFLYRAIFQKQADLTAQV